MTKHKAAQRQYSHSDTSAAPLFSVSVKCFALTLCISALLRLTFAYIAYSFDDPASAVDGAAYICLGLSSFAGGICAAVISRENSGTVSLISGGMFVCTLLIFALAFDSIGSPLLMLLGYAVSVALTFFGAFLTRRLYGTRKKKRRSAY